MVDDFDRLLGLAMEIAYGNEDDPGFDEKSEELVKLFYENIAPKNYVTMLDPVVFQQVMTSIGKIKKSVEQALRFRFGDDIVPEYKLKFWGLRNEHMEFEIQVRDAYFSVPSLDVWEIARTLPDSFGIGAAPIKDGFAITFTFYNVKSKVSETY